MTICQHCRAEIQRLTVLEDEHVYRSSRDQLIASLNQVDEAWSDGYMLVCEGNGKSAPYRWHEPLPALGDILEELRFIETDLR
jgi:hypothetical protein